jgi:ATP/maltotriose-dependent transcriptional regulator MalT
VASFEHALAIAVEDRNADEVWRVYTNLSEVLIGCGRSERVREVIDEGLRVCQQMGSPGAMDLGPRIHAALAEFEFGRWDRAVEWAEGARPDATASNDELYLLTRIVELTVARGDWVEADRQLRRIADLLSRYPVELQYTGPYATARAELALWRRDPLGALEAVDAGIARLEQTDDLIFRVRLLRLGLRAAADLAERTPVRNGRNPDHEAVLIGEALRDRVSPQLAAMEAMDGGFLLAMRAEVALAAAEETRLRNAPTPGSWREAADLWQARERPYVVGYARWREAEACLRLRERRAAGAALVAAATIADDLGAAPLRRAVGQTARRARLALPREAAEAEEPVSRVDRTHAGGVAGDLTVRELEVLGLVAQGLTDRQIADALFVSRNTVGVHVSRILGKLAVSTRTEAAAVAYRTGLVRP